MLTCLIFIPPQSTFLELAGSHTGGVWRGDSCLRTAVGTWALKIATHSSTPETTPATKTEE